LIDEQWKTGTTKGDTHERVARPGNVKLGSTKLGYETEAHSTFLPVKNEKGHFEESRKIKDKYT
jgi:hypothetical protein